MGKDHYAAIANSYNDSMYNVDPVLHIGELERYITPQ
jgi:hypothetical protein